jgi:hypothetical protein
MHISSFVNKPDEVSPHSNEYAAGTVSLQTFAERKEIEKTRSVVGGYLQSQIGTSYIDRSVLQKPQPRPPVTSLKRTNSRQEMNSRTSSRYARPDTHTFREPPLVDIIRTHRVGNIPLQHLIIKKRPSGVIF